MKIKLSLLTAGAALLLSALPLLAHHSFAAEYDASKPFTVKGTFTKMDWVNPHSWIHLDVKAADGSIEHWSCEALPPNGLYRQGWRKDSLKAGEEITVVGFKSKDGTSVMWTSSVTTADGRRMFAGSPEGPGGGAQAPGQGAPGTTPPPAPPKE
ncbi:MAG TPA: DUF6152 family protein [Bryobacteraceae bacterium]|nr:DUF6152 family protein [Bryobacteraceae bacterium]